MRREAVMSGGSTRVLQVDSAAPDAGVIGEAAEVIRAGGLVAFPTETVYGLGANGLDAAAVERIFHAKARPASDPIIVHVAADTQVLDVAAPPPPLFKVLANAFWPGPLTLVLERLPNIPAAISAGLPTVAVRMPSHPVALALLSAAGVPIAAPSANCFARPSATSASHVLEDLGGRIDLILDAGPTPMGIESTILDVTRTPPVLLRPGGVTLEALLPFVPDLVVATRFLSLESADIEAPGMLLKHYSPRADLLLFEGAGDLVRATMRIRAAALSAAGRQVGVLVFEDEGAAFEGLDVAVVSLGTSSHEAAHRLFAGMRTLDSFGVDAILVRAPERVGIGVALYDRLIRAAEGRVEVVSA